MKKPVFVMLGLLLAALVMSGCDREPTPPAATRKVSGEAFYLQKIALPQDAVLKVWLEDVSLMDVPALLLSEQRIELKGRQQPFAFELGYHPSQLTAGHVYAVSGSIEDASGLRFINTEQHSLLLVGQDANLRLKLDQVTPAGPTQAMSKTPDFVCNGNEPFWGLELRRDKLKLSRLVKKVKEKHYTGSFSRYSALDGGAGYQWQGLASKGRNSTLVADIWLDHCVDNMAGNDEGVEYDYQIILSVDDEQLSGCCRLVAAGAPDVIRYQCEDDLRITAQLEGSVSARVAVLGLPDGKSLRLLQQPTSSGALFISDNNKFWSSGDDARLTLDGAAAQHCLRLD